MSENSKAALLYIPAVIALSAIWYSFLFVGSAPSDSAVDLLLFSLRDGPKPLWFRWILSLPVLCVALGIAHASPIAHRKLGRMLLLIFGIVVAGTSWFTTSPEVSVFVTLPVFYAFRGAYRG